MNQLIRDALCDMGHEEAVIFDGPDFDEAKELSLATFVEVAGKKMQVDFESVIERKFHAWFNYMEGVMHTGQRNQVRVRVSNGAFENGLTLKHFAEVFVLLIEVRHIGNLLAAEHCSDRSKCLLSCHIIVEETDDLVVEPEVVGCSVQIAYRVQDNDITGGTQG